MKYLSSLVVLSALATPAPHSALAAGSQPRSWVSAARGADAAGCGTTASPCRTFQYAFDNVTKSGGAILALDPGEYGPISIINPISVVNDGVGGVTISSSSPANGNAVDINLPSGGNVVLKGLTINGAAAGAGNGVKMASGGRLTVSHCVISGYSYGTGVSGHGVLIAPASGSAQFTVSDSALSGNGWAGIWIAPNASAPGSASAEGVVRRVHMSGNDTGFSASGGNTSGSVKVAIEESVVSANSTFGLYLLGSNVTVTINRVTARFNGGQGFPSDISNTNGATLTSFNTNNYAASSGTVTTGALH
ncbi:MAG: hypothetical protein QM651_04430 [Rhodoblastus sp.]